MFLCAEVVNFCINYAYRTLQHIMALFSLSVIFLVMNLFPNRELPKQRRLLLAIVSFCLVASSASSVIDISTYLDRRHPKM